jgi:beta-glucosidase
MLLAFFTVSFASIALAQTTASEKPAYLNPNLPTDIRVDDLVSRMTLEEKASQVVHQAKAIPRLGVPAYNWWSEALHGVVTTHVTVFPEPIGLAATFDAPAIHEMAIATGTEGRARHHDLVRNGILNSIGLDFWAPNLNIFRDPRWGRGQETYGEDPYLTGVMGSAFVRGMQGDDPKYLRTIATPKHYAVHSGPEPSRHRFDAKVSKHDMEDTFLPAFRAAVTDGKAGSIMCVYNRVNGEPGCANNFLLQDQLRDQWGFRGYVASDCDAVLDIQRGHHFVNTPAEAAAVSMARGTDLDCNEPGDDSSHYVDAVKQGLLSLQDLDRSVKRLFRARFQLGMFDPPELVAYAQTPASEANSEPHRQLAAKLARESMVLLKNNGLLPLRQPVKKIAVVGPLADSTKVLHGNYFGSTSRMTSALDGIRRQFPAAQVTFSPGTTLLRETTAAIPEKFLWTDDGKPGLKAEYFQGVDLAGPPAFVRIDKQVDFEFDEAVVPGLGPMYFSARWTGVLRPDKTATYEIGASGDDGYRLWIDGKVVAEDWSNHVVTTQLSKLDLQQGHSYSVKMEYFQSGGAAIARLVWALPSSTNEESLHQAIAAARKADIVIAVVGITSELEGEEMNVNLPGFMGGDRTSLDLPQQEEELLKAVKQTGKPLIVVLMNGSALAVNWAKQNADAILDAWYSGEEGGTAIAETLAGVNNPAGRLPVTFYTGVEQLPAFEDYSMKDRTYRYFTGTPLYPFGYGLSYSKFAYSNLKFFSETLHAGAPLTVAADVRNTSDVAGDEVVQLYLSFPAVDGAPIRAIRGFSRIHLAAGETQPVQFILSPRDLSMVNAAGDRLIAPGDYRISVGGGQPGTGAPAVESKFSILGQQILPE